MEISNVEWVFEVPFLTNLPMENGFVVNLDNVLHTSDITEMNPDKSKIEVNPKETNLAEAA